MLNNSSWRKELPSESRGGLGSITVGAVVAAATEAGGPSAARRSLDLESAGGGRHRQAHRRWWQRVVGVGRRRRWRVVELRLFGCIHGGRALDQLRDGRRRGLGDYLESISVLSHCYSKTGIIRSKRKKGGRRGQGKILGSKGSDIPPNAAAEGDKKGPEEEKGGVGGREGGGGGKGYGKGELMRQQKQRAITADNCRAQGFLGVALKPFAMDPPRHPTSMIKKQGFSPPL
ncbi:hypothetical protein GW17_00007731 [Ensete ventricosum]|nr:hypothetical protein GW17_00007731 [Ensete ventricosum]